MQERGLSDTMFGKNSLFVPATLILTGLLGVPTTNAAQALPTLTASVDPPAPVGTMVRWTASPTNDTGSLWYRFRVRQAGQEFGTIRDFGPLNTLDWTASEQEGTYEVEVSVRDRNSGDVAQTSALYQFTSRVSDTPVLNPTTNPLVFLYSAPECPSGSSMRVQFQSPEGFLQTTPLKPCQTGVSMNFYLAGMRPATQYTVKHVVTDGASSQDGPTLTLTTSDVPADLGLPTQTVESGTPSNGLILHSPVDGIPSATDLNGNLVWYYAADSISKLTRPAEGGHFAGIVEIHGKDQSFQTVREFDLAGMTLRETNAARLNEQLTAMGKRPVSSFHHEAVHLPDGKLLVLANVEQVLTDVQDPGPVDILGDMIIVLDRDLQVAWTWDAFDHLDPRRKAILGETCTPTGGGCPTFFLAPKANDWLHGNSVQQTPDGNLLYSARHQDWIIKIDFGNGNGSGDIIWRLGKDGDFQFNSSDPYPWSSHQHDAGFESGDNSTVMLFDNGNTRRASDPSAHSRGQVIRLDEVNRVATLVLNANLGTYSAALGSAQKLQNGDYHFLAGSEPDGTAMSMEVDPSGRPVYMLHGSAIEYRSHRMQDLYTP